MSHHRKVVGEYWSRCEGQWQLQMRQVKQEQNRRRVQLSSASFDRQTNNYNMTLCQYVIKSWIYRVQIKNSSVKIEQIEQSTSSRFIQCVDNNNYIIGWMTTKPKTKRIGKYHFRLIGQPNLYFKGQHTVSFTPPSKNKQKINTKILPTFNFDRKYYTYAFQLPSANPQNDEQMKQEHQKRALQSMIQLSQMLMPKPRSRNKYCGVCRNHYQDYKDHIQGEIHQSNLKKSQYQALISQVCDEYQQKFTKKWSQQPKGLEITSEEMQFKLNDQLFIAQNDNNAQLA